MRMRHEVTIRLIPTDERTVGGNMIRDPLREQARTVFAFAYSVGMGEFYSSTQAGIDIDAKFDLWAHEYRGELLLEYNGQEYDVVRSYRNGDRMELTASARKARGMYG